MRECMTGLTSDGTRGGLGTDRIAGRMYIPVR